MKVAIVGFGKQGRSSYLYYKSLGAEISIHDVNPVLNLPDDVQFVIGQNYLENLNDYDIIVRGPRIYPKEIINANGHKILDKVTSNTNEFFRVCNTKNIIGVTGTKGKGTTSTLISKILEEAGYRVHFGGNVGVPPLDLLNEDIKKEDWVVLELANYQTIDLDYSPHIGVCLMVEPEHLDWHGSMEEYCAAKAMMFKRQGPLDVAIYFEPNKNSRNIASAGKGQLIPFYKEPGAFVKEDKMIIDDKVIIENGQIKLIGKHNLQNIAAAITAYWQVDHRIEPVREVLSKFNNLPYRLENRAEIKGITYYNDSFSSNPTATLAAIEAIEKKMVLIVGGMDRGLVLDNLTRAIKDNSKIRKVIIIGEAKNRIATELENIGFNNFEIVNEKRMSKIINTASSYAKKGDAVVLSPGFPSFDMFVDFEDRGNKFNDVVNSL